MYQIMQGDCLEKMKSIPDGSVNLILTDPPYAILTNKESVWRGGMKPINRYEDWDNMTNAQYYRLMLMFCTEALRVGTDTSTIYIFCACEIFMLVQMALKKAGWHYRMPNYWHKTNPAPVWNGRRPQASIETICMATKTKKNTWNVRNGGLCHNLFEYPIVSSSERIHPSQKPVKLMTEVILRSSNPGDTVLDPFMGSASTGVAAIQNGRNFIGIEKNIEHFEKASDRLCKTMVQPRLV